MPLEFQTPNRTYTAAGTINQAAFVTLDGDFTVLQSTTGDSPIGVAALGTKAYNLSYLAASGDPVPVFGESQECWLEIDGNVSAGNRLVPTTGGMAIAGASSGIAGAVALQGGVAGDLIRVRVQTSSIE